jgi:hypothetical protein
VRRPKSVGLWIRHGWHVAVAYVIGFFVMLTVLGWHPDQAHKKGMAAPSSATAQIIEEGKSNGVY